MGAGVGVGVGVTALVGTPVGVGEGVAAGVGSGVAEVHAVRRRRPRMKGQGKELVGEQPHEHEQRKIRPTILGEDDGENEGQHRHHDEWVDERPQDAEGHVPVANLEILRYQITKDKEGIVRTYRSGAPSPGAEGMSDRICRIH